MSFKILYSAGDRSGAKLQLIRLLEHLDPSTYTIKLAGYKRMGLLLDWTLDALHDPLNIANLSLDNDNFEILFEQIKSFDPDLIISDLEIFASYAGQLLHKPVWQVSPKLLEYINLPQMGLHKYTILREHSEYEQELLKNILTNSEKRYVYSHFGDVTNVFALLSDYEWVRPYHYLGAVSLPCAHNMVVMEPPKKMLAALKAYQDVVAFTDSALTNMPNLITKDMANIQEYACNVKNCNYYISSGITDTLADAFYNDKFSTIIPDLFDPECVINMLLTEYYKLGLIAYDGLINVDIGHGISSSHNTKTSFLHQEIDKFFAS